MNFSRCRKTRTRFSAGGRQVPGAASLVFSSHNRHSWMQTHVFLTSWPGNFIKEISGCSWQPLLFPSPDPQACSRAVHNHPQGATLFHQQCNSFPKYGDFSSIQNLTSIKYFFCKYQAKYLCSEWCFSRLSQSQLHSGESCHLLTSLLHGPPL